MKLWEPVGESADLLDDEVDASVPPLETPPMLKQARIWARHCRNVRPSRVTSGSGQGCRCRSSS